MFINKKKIKVGELAIVRENDEISFGASVPKNELRYILIMKEGEEAYLKKSASPSLSSNGKDSVDLSPAKRVSKEVEHPIKGKELQESSQNSVGALQTDSDEVNHTSNDESSSSITPPLVKRPKISVKKKPVPVKKKKLDFESKGKDDDSLSLKSTLPNIPPSIPQNLTTTTAALPHTVGNVDSPSLPVSSIKPSPALSVASTKSTDVEVDDLFDEIISNSDDKMLDEAIFGKDSTGNLLPFLDKQVMDGATIQVMAAQNSMEQEKHKLLSSIEALKSELAAKNELIAKKKDDEKKEKEETNLVSSMVEEFTCVICQELFVSAHTLPCSHSFCEWCIKEWMKTKKRKECPICRKTISSNPVHSLVLDNAISKMELKLSSKEKQEREELKEEYKKSLGTRSASGAKPVTGPNRNPVTGSTRVTTPRNDVIVIDSLSSITVTDNPSHPIMVNDNDETSEEETDDDDDDETDDEGDYYDYRSGYGGYGRCYNCGKNEILVMNKKI